MIDALAATGRALTKVKELAGPFDPTIATFSHQPLPLPGGWRFPFDIHLDDSRLSGQITILFVDQKTGQVETEWDNLQAIRDITPDDYQPQKEPPLRFSQVLEALQKDFPGARVETAEKVLTISDDRKIWPGWRIGLVEEGFNRSVVQVTRTPDGMIQHTEPQVRSRSATIRWNIGGSRYRSRSGLITINLKELAENQEYWRGQWMVWSCIAHTAQYLSRLGYPWIEHHSIRVELLDTMGGIGKYDRVEKVPVISFDLNRGATDDPTIVCHELGHAVWDLLFTRPAPLMLVDGENKGLYEGLQEGFADYFAGAMLAAGQDVGTVIIGGALPRKLVLPRIRRVLDGRPYSIRPTGDTEGKKYEVGRKWANFLWDLRRQLDPRQGDAVILRAHFKPLVPTGGPIEPKAAYFQSLRQTAADFVKVDFMGWDRLAEVHQIYDEW